ncbi:CoA ester lyase [Iodidimonas nitroreducens]|uniref:CoA ester lyase n=1 Tax=Iodidimonas nitroreducens TaxID=1236968 RepID=A0A5A7N706_9PROT|nr:CoA ester lyase [Iodidimonas nitroreducens]GAK33318.1 malyl-CoA lyase [alpha proteobacterium Q-1]GER04091.1 CoA ester lyase [Iodidimonas nitroreducens]
MSFTEITEAPARLNRSELAVPGSNRRFLEKAAQSAADVVFLDLEDSVSPALKDEARRNVIEALNDLDWGEKTVSLRLNGLDTAWTYRDVVDVLEKTGERLDLMMLPKVGVAADVYALDVLVSQVERARGRKKRIGFELIIESAMGLANAYAIAGASPRNESLHFGVADFAASVHADTTQIGGPNPRYAVLTDPLDDGGRRDIHWGDMWHYPVWQMVVAARAHGLRPIDGPFGDFSDEAGFRAHAARAMVLGCEGKWAIHPSQVALANAVFSPSADELAKAQKILDAMEKAEASGQGAVALDGKLIDLASIRQAKAMIKKAKAMDVASS